MPKVPEPESFETLGKRYSQAEDRNALLAQISEEFQKIKTSSAIRITFQGDSLIVRYHCIEQFLDERSRVDLLTKEADKLLKDFVKYLKSEFKKRGGGILSLKEDKDRRKYDIQKINLNGRFQYTYQQVYDF